MNAADGSPRAPGSLARPGLRQLALLVVYLAAGVAVTWPRASYLTGLLPESRDVSSYVWDLQWIAHQVIHLGNPNWYHLNIALGTLFLPMTLEAAVRLRRRPGRRQAVILGLVLGASVLVNQESAVLAVILAGVILLPWLLGLGTAVAAGASAAAEPGGAGRPGCSPCCGCAALCSPSGPP